MEQIKEKVIWRRLPPSIFDTYPHNPSRRLFRQYLCDQSSQTTVNAMLLDCHNDPRSFTSLDEFIRVDRLDRGNMKNARRNSLLREQICGLLAPIRLRSGRDQKNVGSLFELDGAS